MARPIPDNHQYNIRRDNQPNRQVNISDDLVGIILLVIVVSFLLAISGCMSLFHCGRSLSENTKTTKNNPVFIDTTKNNVEIIDNTGSSCIRINSYIGWSQIYINNNYVGPAPFRKYLNIKAGQICIKVISNDGNTFSYDLNCIRDIYYYISVDLKSGQFNVENSSEIILKE